MKHESKSSWHYLYGARWQKQRIAFLHRNPLCAYCLQLDKITSANVVDHKVPHKGDKILFWDVDNWQSLCKECHDNAKALEESKGFAPGCGQDGMPVDPKHPWYDE
jgi:5-methylcytosine-specific restriction protein A